MHLTISSIFKQLIRLASFIIMRRYTSEQFSDFFIAKIFSSLFRITLNIVPYPPYPIYASKNSCSQTSKGSLFKIYMAQLTLLVISSCGRRPSCLILQALSTVFRQTSGQFLTNSKFFVSRSILTPLGNLSPSHSMNLKSSSSQINISTSMFFVESVLCLRMKLVSLPDTASASF